MSGANLLLEGEDRALSRRPSTSLRLVPLPCNGRGGSGFASNLHVLMHVDLAHPALLPGRVDEAAQGLAPFLRAVDAGDDEVAAPRRLVGRADGQPADPGELVDQVEIDAD